MVYTIIDCITAYIIPADRMELSTCKISFGIAAAEFFTYSKGESYASLMDSGQLKNSAKKQRASNRRPLSWLNCTQIRITPERSGHERFGS